MTIDELLVKLDGVRPRGSRYVALCKSHADRTPSLSISQGNKGILIRCWAGCTVAEICSSLGITQQNLFFDALDTDPQRRREATQRRERQRRLREQQAQAQGAFIDLLRESDYFIRSRRELDIGEWSDEKLNAELDALADAYALLERENFDGQLG